MGGGRGAEGSNSVFLSPRGKGPGNCHRAKLQCLRKRVRMIKYRFFASSYLRDLCSSILFYEVVCIH